MSRPDISVEGCQIVVLGRFNPAIFSAGWLLANGFISEEESEDVRPQASLPQISIFEVSWLRCEVTPERLLLGTAESPQYERLRDVASGVLETLRHTPVQSLGINYTYHVAMPSRDAWHKIGDCFAPKEEWEGVLRLPGMKDVTIIGIRPDLYSGSINVTLQPSASVKWGFFLAHNDHFNLKTIEAQPTTRNQFEDLGYLEDIKPTEPSADLIPLAMKILTESWVDSHERAEQIVGMIWDKAVG